MPAGSGRANESGLTVGAIVDESVKTALRAVESADATVRGAVERGVDTAYMVIEEYMLRGRQAAGRNHQRRNGRHEMNDERHGGSNSSNGGFGAGPWGAMNPMAAWMQMMRMWTESMSSLIPGANGLATDWMTQFMPGAAMWGGSSARASIAVHVSSPYPVEVKADLDGGAEYSMLTAEPLRMRSDEDATLAVTLRSTPGLVRIAVTVPDGQAGGRYTGAMNDASGAKRGEITVDIESAAVRSRPAAKKRAGKRSSAKR
ncbi:MAG: hypothetical protein JWL61_349 [Gemmatimonadetes bacterium]|nr:hypothetical protein [Gemmatimonadota bacterium]